MTAPRRSMSVLILGATGMVGQGVLRECLLDTDVTRVLTLGRSATGGNSPKLRELVHSDLRDLSAIADELSGLDACFFCLGVSAVGMSEEQYAAVTYDLTLSVARTLAERNPRMTFIYVSGAGTDSTERGRAMWARVKGRTENALFALPLEAYMFRPGLIIPLHGIASRTSWYRVLYAIMTPLLPIFRRVAPNHVLTTERVGQAMLSVAKRGYAKRILDPPDINRA